MRTALIIVILLFYSILANGQQYSRFATLDRFFAGIPLQSSFESWYSYIANHKYLGIDSTTRRGNHSSFKKGIDSYYPFTDSLKVGIVFQKIIMADARTRQYVDSFKTIEIMGQFGRGKHARRESAKFYKGLRRELMRNYRYEYRDYQGPASWFYRGKSKNFPYCSLHHGYSPKLDSYYVLIAYNDQKSQVVKKYPPPDNTLRGDGRLR